ncbi:MAG: DnaA regulatory inactivator Hda [Alphaproteobacteria bacterium MarineAlpha9_Bin3]|nr:MAG: DnaA regulatory inactivator Hda [Alphaproteobacteria bacterium MarineAlpha9_Bin3]
MNNNYSKQLILNLRTLPSMGRGDYIVSQINEEAVAWLDTWPKWPSLGLIICGPYGCGKSHLASALQTISNGFIIEAQNLTESKLRKLVENKCLIIEDIHKYKSERLLFHIYNMMVERNHNLMFTSNISVSDIDFKLPDLKSRLLSMPRINIGLPDDDLLKSLMLKQFSDKGVLVDFEVVDYLIKRIDRSFESIIKMVSEINNHSLEKSKKITIPFIKKVLKL